MNEYIFPFDTCEKTFENGIAQPYSVIFNAINCIVIFYFLVKTTKIPNFLLLASFLLFELFHTFSHCMHISGSIQITITHSLGYLLIFAFFYLFYNYTKIGITLILGIYLLLVVLVDIYFFFHLPFLYYLGSAAILFNSILFYYYPYLSKSVQTSICLILLLIIVIILLFCNEIYNCHQMMTFYPHFPYHIIIEVVGILLFYIMSSTFYKL